MRKTSAIEKDFIKMKKFQFSKGKKMKLCLKIFQETICVVFIISNSSSVIAADLHDFLNLSWNLSFSLACLSPEFHSSQEKKIFNEKAAAPVCNLPMKSIKTLNNRPKRKD